MTRSLCTGLVLAMMLLLLTAADTSAQRSEHTFIVVNKTNVVINALYVTPHSSKDWGEDILDADVLDINDDIGIVLARRETAKLWDLRIEDSEGNFIEWDRLNLREIYSVSLYYKNGKATAVFDEFVADLAGTWAGYYDDGTRSPYVWSIKQNGANLTITDARRGGTTRSRGTIKGNNVRALDFATQNGKLSSDGNRITWSDRVVWVRQ
jgi:hypothetical protein